MTQGTSKKIVIHAKVGCPYCEDAKSFFTKRKMPFTEIVYDPKKKGYDTKKHALFKSTGQSTFPQIYIGKKFIGGYSDLLYAEKTLNLSL